MSKPATLILTGYFLFVVFYIVSFLTVVEKPAKHIFLRKVFCFLYSIKSMGNDNIIFQFGPKGCGKAALKMLLKRNNINNSLLDSVCANFDLPMNMYSISLIIKNAGLNASGYEFTNDRQLELFLKSNPNSNVMLLMKRYDGIEQLSFMTLIFFPIIILIELYERIKSNSKPELHWVLLDEIADDGFKISDPFLGRILLKRRRFDTCWSKYGLVINR